LTYDIGFSVVPAWFKIVGGGVKAPNGNITVSIPGSQTFIEPELPTQTSPFLIYGPEKNFKNSGAGGTSPDNYEVENGPEVIPPGFSYYNYYSSRFGNKTPLGTWPAAAPTTSNKYVYTGAGDLVVNSAWNVQPGVIVIIFVPTGKNLIVNAPIQVQKGGFLGVIGDSEMHIGSGVGRNSPFLSNYNPVSDAHVSGIYIFNHLETESALGPDKQVILSGTFVTDTVSLTRDLDSENAFPAEQFMYRADLWQNAPDELKEINITWQEVKPK